jgi:preprotein translocase subunit YajC
VSLTALSLGHAILFAATKKTTSSLGSLYILVILAALLIFVVMRPQRKRRQQMQQMRSQIRPGVDIQTAGGLLATVVAVADDAVTVETANGVQLRFVPQAITRVLTPPEPEPASDQEASADPDTGAEAPGSRGEQVEVPANDPSSS